MKAKIFLAALAGVALAGCVTDNEYEVTPESGKAKIVFESPVMYNQGAGTRAEYYGEIGSHQYAQGGVTYTYPRAENFQIYAVQHTGDFAGWAAATAAGFNDTGITYDSSLDGWAPKNNGSYYHWPSGQSMSFAACSPADLEQSGSCQRAYSATGLTITNFQVPATADKHYDLMFSERTVNRSSASMLQGADYYSGVPIKFQHALSSIHFSLRNSSSEKVVLTKVSLYGVHDTGTFTEGLVEDPNDYTKYVRGENVNPDWNVTPGSPLVAEEEAYVAFDGELEFPTNAQYISNLLTQAENAGNTSKNHVLLVLPQSLSDDAKLRVDYTVNGSPAYKIVNLNTAVEDKENGAVISSWVMGTRYTYRLYYSEESASQDKIYFAPSSDGWKDAGTAVIELKN